MGVREHISSSDSARPPKDRFLHGSFYISATRLVIVGSGFIFWIVAARYYSIESTGLASALVSAFGLVTLISRLGLDYSAIRFIPTTDRTKVGDTVLLVTTTTCLLVGTIFVLIAGFVSEGLAEIRGLSRTILFVGVALVESLVLITGVLFIAMRMPTTYLVQNAIMCVRIPMLIVFAKYDDLGIIYAFGFAYLVTSVFSIAMIGRRTGMNRRLHLDAEFLRKAFHFSFWNYVSTLLTSLPVLLLPIIILEISGSPDAARFYICLAISNMLLIVPESMNISIFVEGSHGAEIRAILRKAGALSFALLSILIGGIIVFGERVLGFYGAEYQSAYELLVVLGVSSYLVTISYFYTSVKNIQMRARDVTMVNFIRSVILLTLSIALIGAFGVLGVGIAWLAAHAVASVVMLSDRGFLSSSATTPEVP